jgi:hypothetical protein
MTKRSEGQCVYCGETGILTDDHIPPQCLFGKPRPNDLIRIPSCIRCNNEASKDDEYFKTILVLKDKAGDHPEAVAIRPSVVRALRKSKKRAFARSLARRSQPISIMSPVGLYLGRRMAYNVDLKRLDRVVARITKGLFYSRKGHRVPDGYEVHAFSESGIRDLTSAETAQMHRDLIGPVLNNTPTSIGRGAMRFWVSFAANDPLVSGWIYEFYADVRFAAVTIPASPGT